MTTTVCASALKRQGATPSLRLHPKQGHRPIQHLHSRLPILLCNKHSCHSTETKHTNLKLWYIFQRRALSLMLERRSPHASIKGLAENKISVIDYGYGQFCIRVIKRYDASYNDAICDWNCIGATFRYFGRDIHIQLKVWEHSNAHNNHTDDIIVLSDFVTSYGHAQDKDEFLALCNFIFNAAPLRSPYFVVKHHAVETPIVTFTKEVSVPNALIPCMKLA